MGNGAGKSKSKPVEQQQFPKPSPVIDKHSRSPSLLPPISAQQASIRSPSPLFPISTQPAIIRTPSLSMHSSVSEKQSHTSLLNGNVRRTPFHEMNNISTHQDNESVPLPPIDYGSKASSRSTTRVSSIAPPPPINSSRLLNADAISRTSHRHSSAGLHESFGRCAFCPHCKENIITPRVIQSIRQPSWIVQKPESVTLAIDMAKYDTIAVQKRFTKNGYIPGAYDYQPHITIDNIDDHDQTKTKYYTQPIVAKTKPRISSTHTPFPEYDLLQRREQYSNKPF